METSATWVEKPQNTSKKGFLLLFFFPLCILHKSYPVPYHKFSSSCIGLRFHQCSKNPCTQKDTTIKVPASCSNQKVQASLYHTFFENINLCFQHAPFTLLAIYDPQPKMLIKINCNEYVNLLKNKDRRVNLSGI